MSDGGGIWVGVGVALVCVGIGVGLGITRGCSPDKGGLHSILETGEPVPERTSAQAAKAAVSAEGELLTVKQNASSWLPGGKGKLHLDDITGRQVLASVTEGEKTVIWGPKSIRAGETHEVAVGGEALTIEVVRLKNMLAGGDFGEFKVKRKS